MTPLSAVVFDLDGTLYDTRRMRRAFLPSLVRRALLRPFEAARAFPVLRHYRRAHEALRGIRSPALAERQLQLAAEGAGHPVDVARAIIAEWFEQAPLPAVRAAARPGLASALAALRTGGLRLALLSDYPPLPKLEALAIRQAFDTVAWAQQPDIGALKPDPAGLLRVLEVLQVHPSAALYVGDRPDVDVGVARRAGCRVALIGDHPSRDADVPHFDDLSALAAWLLRAAP